jgi:type IV pilus assembly protein PilM
MAVTQGVWGIDIGQCALKALRLELVDGKPTATAFDYVEHPKILSQPDADPDQLIREALEKFLSRNTTRFDHVAIGIAGQSGLARFVKLPPVEERKIAEIVKFEAKQQIPFPLDEVVWDYQKVAGGEVIDGFATETEIGLFAMKRDVISRNMGYFNAAKIEVNTVQMSPLALVNFTTYETLRKGGKVPADPADDDGDAEETPRGKKRCVVVLDLGTDASNLIITDGEKIIWQRPIPLGGSNFTKALTKELKLTFAKAEHLKRNAGKNPAELPQILKAIKPVLTDFVGEVQRSLGYFTNTHRDAHVAYMVGLGSAFRLPGLQKYLKDKLSLDVRKPDVRFGRLEGDAVVNDPLFQENLLTFPVAYGLALQGLGEARLVTNLLPQEIRTDRLIRAKKPYAAAAAAALLLGTGALAWGYSANLSSVSAKQIADAIKTSEGAVKEAGAQDSAFAAKKSEFEATTGKLKSIIAGNDERLNWPRFMEVFSASVPRPGEKGSLNADAAQKALWVGTNDSGIHAMKWFIDRQLNGVPIEQADDDSKSDHPKNLALVQIESVHSRWVDDVAGFLTAADAAVYGDGKTVGFAESIADHMKDKTSDTADDAERVKDEAQNNRWKPQYKPTGGAWVFEIRGFTDHEKGGKVFMVEGLMKNMRRIDAFVKDEKKVEKFIPGVTDPVKGKMSHAFVYHVWSDGDSASPTFKYINQSYLDPLIVSKASGGGETSDSAMSGGRGSGGGPPPGMNVAGGSGGAGAPAASNWVPLIGPGGGTGSSVPPTGSATSSNSIPRGMTSSAGGGATTATQSTVVGRTRYEFVAMFVWREPVTTDPNAAPK